MTRSGDAPPDHSRVQPRPINRALSRRYGSYPSVVLADGYAVITYYLRHSRLVGEYLGECAIDAERARSANEGRVLLTHDVATLTRFAYERVADGRRMPGVFEIGTDLPLAQAIDDVLLIAECSVDGEREGQVRYLPLR